MIKVLWSQSANNSRRKIDLAKDPLGSSTITVSTITSFLTSGSSPGIPPAIAALVKVKNATANKTFLIFFPYFHIIKRLNQLLVKLLICIFDDILVHINLISLQKWCLISS